MRVPTLNTSERAFEGITRRMTEQARLQEQLSSGKRITRPSDDPLAASQAELARSRLARLAQDKRATDLATGLLSTAEGALGQGVSLLQSARDLLVAAGNGSYSASDRQALAVQLRTIRDQLLDVANAGDGAGGQVFGGLGTNGEVASGSTPQWNAPAGTQRIGENGRYAAALDARLTFMGVPQGNGVFTTASAAGNTGNGWINAGTVSDATQLTSQNYRIEVGGVAGSLSYTVRNTDTGAVLVNAQPLPAGGDLQIDGQRVTVAGTPAPGDTFTIAPSGRQSVFQTLDQAAALLEGTTGPANGSYAEGLQRIQTTLDRALEGISSLRSEVGGELLRVESAQAQGEQQDLAETTRRSQLQDVDVADAVSQLKTNELGVQAALQAYASLNKLSLFQML